VRGELAYVADWSYGLRIFDVADLSRPSQLGTLVTGGFVSAVAIGDERACLGESTNGGALRVIDVEDPSMPELLGSIETSKARDVEVRGTIAYVADEEIGLPGGLRIFDLADPRAPRLAGHYTGCRNALDVALDGDVAALACAHDGLHLVDVRDSSAPALIASMPLAAGAAWSVAASPGHLVLGTDFGIIVYDIRDPARPVELAREATAWAVRGLVIPWPGRVIAACGLAGVYQWRLAIDPR
jgi:hypothetical protein